MLQTAFTRLIGLRHPIMQAPMGGGVTTPELVAAVSNAGGLGVLALGGQLPDMMRAQIRRTRALTDKPFGVNLLLKPELCQPGQAEVCFEEHVPVLSLFWGDPAPYISSAHAASTKVLVQVGSVEEARAAQAAGADAIVAQGVEAGGHVRGEITTMVLVPLVVTAVRPVPVVAAGGVADACGLAAVLALGGAGVALGTRFLASAESAAHAEYKQRVLQASAGETFYGNLFDIGWSDAPHRVLRNSVVDAWLKAGRPASGQRPGEGEVIGEARFGEITFPAPRYGTFLATSEFRGDVEKTALYAGQSCGLVNDSRPAAQIVEEIAAEAEAIIRRLPAQLCQ